MNWIERMYELKGKDLYSQNGEGIYLEYIAHSLNLKSKYFIDIGAGDGFYLSNSRHLKNIGWIGHQVDVERFVTLENIKRLLTWYPSETNNIAFIHHGSLISIDIDGNDYWILQEILKSCKPEIICAEFNAAFTDSRAIKYNSDHFWDGTDYYGFSFEAGVKLAEANGYKVIFQIADMNMIMVRTDLINVPVPPVTFKQSNFFEKSNRTDWVFI